MKAYTIAAGPIEGLYYQTAAYICEAIKKEYKFSCEVLATSGTIENAELLQQDKVDLAFVQQNYTVPTHYMVYKELYREYFIILYKSTIPLTQYGLENLTYYINRKSGTYTSLLNFISIFNLKFNKYYISDLEIDQFHEFCYNDLEMVFFHVGYPSNVVDSYLATCSNVNVYSIKNYNKNIYYGFQGIETLQIDGENINLLYTTVNILAKDKPSQEIAISILTKYKRYLKEANKHLENSQSF